MQDENNTTPVEPLREETPVSQDVKKSTFSIHYIIELALFAGLVLLYVLYFMKPKAEEPPMLLQHSSAGNKTVFVNLDTLNVRYEFVKVLSGDLEATGQKFQNEILNEQKKLETDIAEFQRQVQANIIPESKAKVKYEELMVRQQSLVEKKDRYTQQVAEKEMRMHQTLLDTVTNFLKRYNKSYGYDYILGYSKAGDILLANDTLDITSHVVKALNENYSANK